MKLAEWAEAHGLSDREIAERMTGNLRQTDPVARPVSVPAVQKYRAGKAVPGRTRMAAIVAVTGAWVQPNDFYAPHD